MFLFTPTHPQDGDQLLFVDVLDLVEYVQHKGINSFVVNKINVYTKPEPTGENAKLNVAPKRLVPLSRSDEPDTERDRR